MTNQEMELGNIIFGHSRGKFPVDRKHQNHFCERLAKLGFDGYGHFDTDTFIEHGPYAGKKAVINAFNQQLIKTDLINDPDFEKPVPDRYYQIVVDGTPVATIRPYYWGDSEVIEDKPNFIMHTHGVELSWYKYALRDSYTNVKLTTEVINDLFDHLQEAILTNLYQIENQTKK